mgnify:CR=1 FL=1
MEDDSRDLEKRTAAFFAAITRRDWDDAIERIHPEARAMQNFQNSVGSKPIVRAFLSKFLMIDIERTRLQTCRKPIRTIASRKQVIFCRAANSVEFARLRTTPAALWSRSITRESSGAPERSS